MAGETIRINEGADADALLLWDSVWDPEEGRADWAMAGDEPQNHGGLRARAALHTAVILSLFSDRRIEKEHPCYWLADGDPRGYFGDGVDVRDDLGEAPLGSHLWLLERAPLTINALPAEHWAVQFATEALMPLQRQGVVVRMEIDATADRLRSRLKLFVRLFGRDGANVYDRNFDIVWNQVAR